MSTNGQMEAVKAQQEGKEESDYRHLGIMQAGNAGAGLPIQDRQFLETFGSPDISDEDDPDDDLEGMVKTELSRLNMFGNIDDEELRKNVILNQNKAEQLKLESIPERGPGSKCVGLYRAIVTGNPKEAKRPKLTPAMSRRIDSAIGEESVRSQQYSLSLYGKALEAITQIQSAVFTDKASGGGRKGLIGKAGSFLFGD